MQNNIIYLESHQVEFVRHGPNPDHRGWYNYEKTEYQLAGYLRKFLDQDECQRDAFAPGPYPIIVISQYTDEQGPYYADCDPHQAECLAEALGYTATIRTKRYIDINEPHLHIVSNICPLSHKYHAYKFRDHTYAMLLTLQLSDNLSPYHTYSLPQIWKLYSRLYRD